MSYDIKVSHWELRSVIGFNNKFYFRVNTIKLINNKYETAVMPCDPNGKLTDLYIYFYNTHTTQDEAADFHVEVATLLEELAKSTSEEVEDLVQYIDTNMRILTRYKESVHYSYPEDILGESHR